jgi:hypothetical protein
MIKNLRFLQCVAIFAIFLISFEAKAQWSANPAVNTAICNATSSQSLPEIISDGSGGYIITWTDYRSGNGDIYAQKINSNGVVQWTIDGVAICSVAGIQTNAQLISDGSGGAIITWGDYRSQFNHDIYAQRISSTGNVLWTANGVAICDAINNQYYPRLISDGSGGAIITWQDLRGQVTYDIFAQKINTSGIVQWQANGVAICNALNNQYNHQLISDGSGGAIITWQDYRSQNNDDVYAQKINTSGVTQWTTDGVAICTALNIQSNPQLISDGSDGAIITWQDLRSGTSTDIYTQRINTSGIVQWTANGVAICSANSSQYYPKLVSDGSSGAIITWQDYRIGYNFDAYAQRINLNGIVQWTVDGVQVCSAIGDQFSIKIVKDGSNGAIISWEDERSLNNNDIYAQKINLNGIVQWTIDGVAIGTAQEGQNSPQLVSDGTGGAIITWSDYRDYSSQDIYAQKINSNGTLGQNLTPPTVQAKYIGVTGKTANSISIKLNKGSGGVGMFAKTLILVSSYETYYGISISNPDSSGNGGNTVSFASINSNTSASANSNINIAWDWTAVYYGSENTVNITDLKPNTKYWIVAVAANDNNGDGIGAYFSNTWDLQPNNNFSNPRRITTLAPASLSGPSNINTAKRNQNSISLNWTNDAASVDGYIVDFANDASFTNFSGMTYYNNFDIGNTNHWEFDGLVAGKAYYNRIKSYAGNVQSQYKKPDSTGKVYTLAAEPISSASFTKSTYGANGEVTFNWSGGATLSPNKSYLVTLGDYQNYSNPMDGEDYKFSPMGQNNNYPNGMWVGNHHVVYDGTASSVTVTGLEHNRNYNVKVYVYDTGLNGPFDKNYRTGDAAEMSFKNLSKRPSQQASNLRVVSSNNSAGTSSFDLEWDSSVFPIIPKFYDSTGTGNNPPPPVPGYIAVVYPDTIINFIPDPGQSYPPSNSYGAPDSNSFSGLNIGALLAPNGSALPNGIKVMFDGGNTACQIRGLNPETKYTLVVYAYGWDGQDPNTKNYLGTVSTNKLTRYSLDNPPTPVKNLVVRKYISGNIKKVTLNWESNGSDKFLLAAKLGGNDAGEVFIPGLSNGSAPNWGANPSSTFGTVTFENGTYSYLFNGTSKSATFTTDNTTKHLNCYVVPFNSNAINNESNNYGNAFALTDVMLGTRAGAVPLRSTNSVSFTYYPGAGYTKLIGLYNKDNNSFDGPYNNNSYTTTYQFLNSSNTLGGNVSFSLPIPELNNTGKTGMYEETIYGDNNSSTYTNRPYITFDGLVPDQIYNFRVHGYNGGNSTELYTADDSSFASYQHTTLALQPTNQASSLTTSFVTDVSAVLNWTAGSGTKSVIFAGTSASAINQFPQDGSSLIANNDYSSNLSNLIGGAKVVYQGNGTSATITGLPSNTEMFYAVYTFSGNTANLNNTGKGSENYDETLYDLNIFKSNRISAKTLAPKPAMATALNFSLAERGESQMRIAWTDNTSGLSKYLVLANSSNTFGLPKDGVSYSAGNASYSSAPYFIDYAGKIVYNGNNIDNILIENLPTSVDGTPIYYRVYSYLGDPGSERYSNPASAKMITLSNDPNTNIPSTISATKGNNGLVSFNWTNGNVNDKNILFYRAGGTPTGPMSGIYNIDGSNIDTDTKVLANDLATGTTSRTMSGNFTPGVSYTLKLAAYKGIRYADGDIYTSPNDGTYSVGSNRFNSVSFPTSVTFVPLTAEPTTTSVVTTFNPTINSLDVSWTQASGANRYLVVVKQSSSATLSPLDGSSWINNSINKYSQNYTYDYGTYSSNAFTGSTEVASVVYNGSGTGTTILGLNTNATYYITVYPFNQTGVGIESENYGAGTTVNRSTLVAKPSTASGLNISNVRSSTAVLNYSHSAENVLILGAKSSTQTDLPTSGSTYSVGDLIGNSKVYYIGNLSSSTISGLSANTQYTFTVFAFNGSGGKENYASGSNTSTTTTGAPSIPTSLEITSGTVSPLTYTTGTSYSLIVKIKDQDGFYVGAVAGQGTIAVAIGGTSKTLTTMATVVGTDTYSLSSFDFSTYNSGNGGVGLTLSVSCGTLTNAAQTGITLLASAPTVSPTLASLKSGSTLQLTITLNGTGSNANAGFAAITKQTNISGAFPNAGDFTTKGVIDGALPTTISASHIFNQLDLIYIGSTLSLNITSCTAGKYYKTSIIPYKGATTAPGSLNYTTGNLVSSSKFMKLNQSEGNLDPDYSEDGTGFDMSNILTNPIVDKIEFDLYNYADGVYNVQITNLNGDVVATGYNNVFFGKGTQRISIPFGNNVAAGSYFITVSNGTDIQMGSFIVMP